MPKKDIDKVDIVDGVVPLEPSNDPKNRPTAKKTLGQTTQRTKKIQKKVRKNQKKREDTAKKAQKVLSKTKKETLTQTERRTANQLGLNSKKGVLVQDSEKELTEKQEKLIDKQEKVWEPLSKCHVEFLSSSEDEVLFSGGRGSGKSDCLVVDPLPYCTNKKFRGLLIRRTMKELRELISRAQDLYPTVYPGTKFKSQDKIFEFPSGAKMEFGYCERMDDLEQYRGQEYQWLGIDELTQFESPEVIDRMKASMRTTDKNIPIYFRATTNPSGIGRLWVKERFIDAGPSSSSIIFSYDTPLGEMKLSRKWIHSTIYDNTALIEAKPEYVRDLHTYSGPLLDQWLHGSWDSAEGMAFEEFNRNRHTCEPFEIPAYWKKFRACDWGYGRALAVCLWMAVNPENGVIYVYREFCANGSPDEMRKYGLSKLNAVEFARRVRELEANERIHYGVIDGSIDAQRGEVGPSIMEQMRQAGCSWKKADRSKGSRKAGKMKIHEMLAVDPDINLPKLQIFNNCTQIVRELSTLPLDDKDPEDVDTDATDHAYDALRYGLMSRPGGGFMQGPLYQDYSRMTSAPVIISSSVGY